MIRHGFGQAVQNGMYKCINTLSKTTKAQPYDAYYEEERIVHECVRDQHGYSLLEVVSDSERCDKNQWHRK